jgi:hypothetical protein
MMILRLHLVAALALAAIALALPAQAQSFIQPGTNGSVTLSALDGATSMSGGVIRASVREVAADEDYEREAILFQIPHFTSAPAEFTAPFAFTRHSRTRILLINSDDASPLKVRAAFFDRAGTSLGCNDITLDPHQRRSRKVQNIPLTPCP